MIYARAISRGKTIKPTPGGGPPIDEGIKRGRGGTLDTTEGAV